MNKRFYIILCVMFVFLGLLGCSSSRYQEKVGINFVNKVENQIPKDLLGRIEKYWKLRKEVRARECYDYEVRHLMGVDYDGLYEVYIKKFNNAKVKKVEIVKVYANSKWNQYDEVCVDLKFYLLKKNKFGNKEFYQKDCWVYIDGGWFHLLNNKLLFKY